MPLKIGPGLLICTLIGLFLASAIASYAETVTYFYDDLNRLARAVYDNGTVIQYSYDEVGNRLEERIELDTTPPTGTTTIDLGAGFTNSTNIFLTLFCNDENGCLEMQFSNDGITYSAAESFASTKLWTLSPGIGTKTVYVKYRDAAGVWSDPFTDTIAACTSSSARIGGTAYATLQAAYNVASDGSTIKLLGMRLIESPNINKDINITLEGGYDCGFTTNIGGVTFIRGMITTTAGKITIKNLVLGDAIVTETTPPTTTPSPGGGVYGGPLLVTLSCSDGAGTGCKEIRYTTNGLEPDSSSPVYSSPINISLTAALKFFGKDFSNNSETVKTQTYILSTDPPIRIGGASYTSLQAAYNAAVSGDVIKCRNILFTENLSINRNITVSLEGGYNNGFTTNVGGQTTFKGMLTTTSGGGTLTIENFVLAR